jgi:tRNA(adenine34) deaminase
MRPIDEGFMRLALGEAEKALKRRDFPVGAVLVHENKAIAQANRHSHLMHAETMTLTVAERLLGELPRAGLTMYTTLQPCMMCFGTMLNMRIDRIVYALPDPYGGVTTFAESELPPRHIGRLPLVISDVCREESKALFRSFYEQTDIPFWKNPNNPLVKLVMGEG